METFNFVQYRQATAQTVAAQCQDSASFADLLASLPGLATEPDRILEQHPGGDRSHIACGLGCSSCCVVNVATLIPEGIAIARFLRQLDGNLQHQIRSRLEALWCEVRGLDEEERLSMRRKCAFLDAQGECLIYVDRPLLCRSLTSTSAESCRNVLLGQIFGEEQTILVHQFQQQLYEALFTGLADGLEMSGLDGRSYQLSGLVRFLWRFPEGESELFAGRRLVWQDLY